METRYVASVFDKSTRYFARIQSTLIAALVLGATAALAAATDYAKEVTQSRLFMEPLAWVGTQPPPDEESMELLGDVGIFKSDGVQAGLKSLEFFLNEHPHSAWAPALEVNMAEYYRRTGRYSLALSHWQSAWDATKNSKDAAGQKIAVRAFAGWTRLLASLGHKEELQALYKELDALHLRLGGYSTTIEETKEGMETMIGKPGISYRCGSYALGHLAMALGMKQPAILKLFGADSPDGGFTMAELLTLAKTNGLVVEAVRRPAGAELVVPCVVHWKLNHYAAILGKEGDRYRVEDPTFERSVLMDAATINEESSGDFILPRNEVPVSWIKLSTLACAKIYGKGIAAYFNDPDDDPKCSCPPCGDNDDSSSDPPASNDGAGGDGDNPPNSKSPGCGMPEWSVHEPYITLWLTDVPLLYHRSDGTWVKLIMTYKHRGEIHGPAFSGFGDNWSCNWLGIMEQPSGSAQFIDWIPGGGQRPYDTNSPDYKTGNRLAIVCVPHISPCLHVPINAAPTGSQNVYNATASDAMGDTFFFLTQRMDRYGRSLETFNYVTNGNFVYLDSMMDLDGRKNTITYGDGTHPNLITAVADPYGNTAHFNYDTNGLLTNIVDAQGISSYFEYDGDEVITNLTTPYGTNVFQCFDAPDPINNLPDRALLITEANGDHQLYLHVANSQEQIGGLDPMAESYHWNRRQYELISEHTNVFAMTNADYDLASIKTWMYDSVFQTNGNYAGLLNDTLWGQADPVDPAVNERPNAIEYSYLGSGGGPDGSETVGEPGSLKVVTAISTASGAVAITRNNLGRPTSYTYYDSDGQTWYFLASYTNIFDSSGTILQYELGPNNELTRGYGYDPVITNLLTSVTNAVKDVIRYTHQVGTLKVTSITFPTGLVCTNIYYANGPSAGFLAEQIDLGIRTNYFAYTNGNLSIQTNELGLVTTYTHDKLNRLTSISYPDLTTVSNVYNNLDIVATKDRLNQWTRYKYNAVRQLMAVTNANTQVTTYDYCSCGSPDLITRLDGSASYPTHFSYDIIGRLTNALYPDGYQLSYGYDNMDRVTSITDGDSHQLTLYWYQFGLESLLAAASLHGQYLLLRQFDQYGRVWSSQDRNGVSTTNGYDFLGRLVGRQVGSVAAPSGLEIFGYSARGLTNYVDALGHTTTFVRDAAGRVLAETNGNNEVLQFTYNASDELLALTDGRLQTTTWKYDWYGRVTNKLDANNTNLFFYQYDADDRLTNRWTPAKGTTVYRYDPVGNLTNVDYSGGTNYTSPIFFAYDGLNRLTNMLDGLGNTTFAWTPGDQLAGENGPWPVDSVAYSYDSGSRQRSGISIAEPNSSAWTQSYGYDSLMLLNNVTSPAGEFTYGYQYVPGFGGDRVLSVEVNDGSIATANQYDGLDRLKDIYMSTGIWGFERTYYYDAGSEVTQQVFTPGNVINYTYDNIGQLKTAQGFDPQTWNGQQYVNPPRLQEQFAYAYDAAWNLNTRTNNAFLQANTVNNLNELTRVTGTGTLTVAGTATEPSGNSPTYASPGVTNVTVNTSNAVVYGDGTFAATNFSLVSGINTFTAIAQDNIGRTDTNTVSVFLPANDNMDYDFNGNMLRERSAVGGTNRNFAYDDENQLVSVWVANTWSNCFVYDGLLRKRIEKDYSWTGSIWQETNEIRFVYDGYVVVQERDGNNLPRVTYTRGLDLGGNESPLLGQMVDGFQAAGGIGGLLARTDMGLWVANQPFASAYYFSDAQGNVVAIVNTNGTVAAQYEYDPFGNMISMSGPLASANRYRFSSKEWNDNAGLYYYGFRFYDPNLQRWLNRDPIGERGSINLYSFIFNDALVAVDNFGLDTYFCNRNFPSFGANAVPRWDPFSHTFAFTTSPFTLLSDPNQGIKTYSWGNNGIIGNWNNNNRPEDINAAKESLANGDAQKMGGSSLDPYVAQAYNDLNQPGNGHLNGVVCNNCKSEANNLLNSAQSLQNAANALQNPPNTGSNVNAPPASVTAPTCN